MNAVLPGYGCYHLRVLDDSGNGMAGGIFGVPNPYIKIRNNQVGVIVQTTGLFETEFSANIEAGTASTGTETTEDMLLDIFPNPAHDVLSVILPDPGNYRIQVTDAGSGRVLQTMKAYAAEEKFRLDISTTGLPPGCKILSLQHEKRTIHARFFKL